jgi:hypothetical protein
LMDGHSSRGGFDHGLVVVRRFHVITSFLAFGIL